MAIEIEPLITENDRAVARANVRRSSRGSTLGGVFLVALTDAVASLLAVAFVPHLGTGLALAVAAFAVALTTPLLFGISRLATTRAIREGAASAANERRMVAEAHRREFETRLANELEMAEGEPEVLDTVERALAGTLPGARVEVLLADNSHAHLARMVVSSPDAEPPGCPVNSPDECPAARRSQVQRFDDSDALGVCPKLRGRPQGRCSAVCVPVSIMGRTVGVIHTTDAPNAVFDGARVQDLQTLANQAGARLGMLRIMAETQLQAATDGLTGLLNRRSLENKIRALRNEQTSFAFAMADLDHFKALNDAHGHETGDRALRLFAQTLRTLLRDDDLVGRYGGEEFAIVLPGATSRDAADALEHVRVTLPGHVRRAGLPDYTASFGVVEAAIGEDLEAVARRADAALFHAKRDGRDRIVVHSDHGMHEEHNGASQAAGNGHHPDRELADAATPHS